MRMRSESAWQWMKHLLVETGERDARASAWGDEEPNRAEWLARRPSLPPLFFLASALWVGTALAIDGLFGMGFEECLALFLMGSAGALVSVYAFWRGGTLFGCVILGLSLGCLLGSAHAAQTLSAQAKLQETAGSISVRAIQDSRSGSYGASFRARAESGETVRIYIPGDKQVLVGDILRITTKWRAPSDQSARESWRKGIAAVTTVDEIVSVGDYGIAAFLRGFRRRAIDEVQLHADASISGLSFETSEASGMLSAVVLGYTDGLYDGDLYQAVKVDGLAHLVAVSGAHLVIVSGFVGAAIRRTSMPRAVGIVLQVMLILAYLVLTGAPTSAIRAAIMATLGFAAYFGARRPYALGALSCCVIGIIALDPSAAYSVSLLLSASATAGIVLFADYLIEVFCGALGFGRGIVSESLALTFSASMFTIPASVFLFSQVSLIAPIANIVTTPAFPLLCIGGFLAITAGVALGELGSLLLTLFLACIQLLCELLKVLSHIPFASIPASFDELIAVLLAIVPAIVLWIAWPRPTVRGICGLTAALGVAGMAFILNPLIRPDTVTMLDIGQGDAILVQSEGRAMLIDTGNQDSALLGGIASCGAWHIDAVLISHPDDDHCGSLDALQGVVGVDRILVAKDLLEDDQGNCTRMRNTAFSMVGKEGTVGLQVGDSVRIGKVWMDVVGPDGYQDDGGNADSLVMLMRYDADEDGIDDVRGLFCGDAEASKVGQYIGKGRIGDIDLYKVGHHGSREAVDRAMLDAIRPEISIVSVGANNRYGHPSPDTIEQLEDAGSRVFRTDEQGAITCVLEKEGIMVRTQR